MSTILRTAPTRRARLAYGVAKGLGRVSRLWGQRGLGTIYSSLYKLPHLADLRVAVEFMPDACFETAVFEPYWGPTVLGGRPYEPELLAVLRRFADLSPTFLDCGANYGFWSIIASSAELHYPRVAAIEANPSTLAQLRVNQALNGSRFECVGAALSDREGEWVSLGASEHHVIAHISKDGTGPKVQTGTIDGIVERLGWTDADRVVLKLDVEGHELAAIEGAKRLTSTRDHVWVVEDFEADGLRTLGALLGLGYSLYYVSKRGACRALGSLPAAKQALASDPIPGRSRNFVAARRDGAFDAALARWASEA